MTTTKKNRASKRAAGNVSPLVGRMYTNRGEDPFKSVKFEKRDSAITNPDGTVVSSSRGVDIPESWSQLATDIVVSKYFRRAGLRGDATMGETSVQQVIFRIARTIREAGVAMAYFASDEEAETFESELAFLLVNQYGAFNSPVWFNLGLFQRYGITGSGGNWAWDDASGTVKETTNAYERPQCSACFIQPVADDLMSIYQLVQNEARLFKWGSGCTSGNSRIYIEGNGFLPIRDLFRRYEAEGRAVHDFDGKGRFIDVSDLELRTLSLDPRTLSYTTDRIDRVWSYDVSADDKITVRFDNGAKTVVSAWHPFLVWDGEYVVERRADALRRGDTVIGPNDTAVKSIPVKDAEVRYVTTYFGREEERCVPITPDVAWLCGYFMGDGSLGEHRSRTTNKHGKTYSYDGLRLRFNDETVEALERALAIIEREFGETATIQPVNGSKCKVLTFNGRRATGFFAALLDPGPKSHTMMMPDFVWEASRDVVMGFIAGLTDSDGCVSDGRVTYSTASREFAVDLGVLVSLHGIGGGAMQDDSVNIVTVLRRSVDGETRRSFAGLLTNPMRKQRLMEHDIESPDRHFTMPLSERVAVELFGDRPPAEWLRTPVGDDVVHLGRLKYDGVINPSKLLRCLRALDRRDSLGAMLARVARSATFVTSVDPCVDNPDFYDLTVASKNNYLAGESGLVTIHNTGTNFSNIRGRQEKLSGGGTSSGLISFLEVFDRAAGATKSGGTTRRAAKLVCLDMDHPEIVDFIEWKSREEKKAQTLIAAGYPSDFNGEAYRTVSGQNSNNSVRVTDAFMNAVDSDGEWQTRMRTTGNVCETFKARDLWRKVAEAAWRCADPAVMYDTTINEWHTCPNTGPIRAANPCVEFHFLDSTSCNLASLNLTKFLRERPNGEIDFDVEGYRHAARVFFVAQEILVDLGSYPTKDIAQNSHDYRPLGLGYANLGTLLMVMGLPYDSDAGRSVASSLTAIMTGHAYRVSAEMAAIKGTFAGYAKNREPMLRVMRKHRDAAYKIDANGPLPGILRAAREDWDEAVRLGEKYGYRNAQASVLAPTGTIGLLMDCDTTGIEPDFSIVKYKKLAGGGYFKIVNASVERALKRLGYTASQSAEIIAYVAGTNSFAAAPVVNREYLKSKGFSDADVERVEAALPGSFTIDGAFAPHVLGADLITRLGVEDESKTKGFSLLAKWGLSRTEIDTLGDHVLGRSSVEGAPHLRAEHYAVFDCANRCGKHGTRFIAPIAHLKMMAAAQPFISGAISKTVNVPNEATVEEIAYIYREGWDIGLKAVALYRDGCKASQPLSSSGDKAQSSADGSSKKTETKAEAPVDAFAPTVTAPINSPQSASVRHRLPRKRFGFTQEARVAGHKVFLRTGDYEDGKLGEIFIDMHKEGASFRSLVNCLAISVSMGLQHGIKLEEYVDQFTFTRFEPQGPVEGHANVKFATSIVDYVFRVLAVEYLNRLDLAHVQPDEHAVSASTDATSTHPVATETRAPTSNPTLGKMMGDAPFCDGCGHVTVRNGTCYRCLNCGNSMGCS